MDLREKYRNFRSVVVLAAAFIAMILNIYYKRELLKSLEILLFVIIVFYIISTIAIKLFDKIRNMEDRKPVEINLEGDESQNEDENSTEEQSSN